MLDDRALWADRDARLPALAGDDRASAERALAAYGAMPKGCEPDHVSRLIASLSWMPRQDGGADQARMQLAIYKTTLSDIDGDVLAAAFREAVKTHTFFPSVAELREIASRMPAPRRVVMAWRLRQLLRAEPEIEPIDTVPVEDVRKLLDTMPADDQTAAPRVPTMAYSRSMPTVEDYVKLGLSEDEALQAWEDYRRMTARPAPTPRPDTKAA